jgi:hypothetical protein
MIGLATACSWTTLILVVIRLNPFYASKLMLLVFYVTLFLALSGTFTLINFYLKIWLHRTPLYYRNISVAFRQGLLLSLATCTLLALQALRVLTWWDALIVVLLIILIEFAFSAKIDQEGAGNRSDEEEV